LDDRNALKLLTKPVTFDYIDQQGPSNKPIARLADERCSERDRRSLTKEPVELLARINVKVDCMVSAW